MDDWNGEPVFAMPRNPRHRFDVDQLASVVSMNLTNRQRGALAWIADGATNAEIARQLKVSEKTIEAELTTIFRTLGVASRIEAAVVGTLVSVGDLTSK